MIGAFVAVAIVAGIMYFKKKKDTTNEDLYNSLPNDKAELMKLLIHIGGWGTYEQMPKATQDFYNKASAEQIKQKLVEMGPDPELAYAK